MTYAASGGSQYSPQVFLQWIQPTGELAANTLLRLTRSIPHNSSVFSSANKSPAGTTMLETIGRGNKPNAPVTQHIQFLRGDGSVIDTYQFDSGAADSNGNVTSRKFWALPYLVPVPDGDIYQVRIVIKSLVDGVEKTAYSRTYPLSILTDYTW